MKKKTNKKRSPGAAVCNALGLFLLIAVIAICLPLTLPKMFGYHIYTVISGSMEPAIPVGSLVYIKEMPPEDVVIDDVIAFYGARDEFSIITHRVVENQILNGEFITKGDANETKDMNPIPYDNFIGKVNLSIPMVGGIAEFLAGTAGKVTAACIVVLSLVLQGVASMFGKQKKESNEEE